MNSRVSHPSWVRICHWLVAASWLTLATSGFLILMVHPRLYLGEVGNDLTPALLTLPISNNHRPDELQRTVVFSELPGSPISADRNYHTFNKNGWARSLHFLAAWILVVVGVVYLAMGIVKRHIVRRPDYKFRQKLAYTGVLFVLLPAMVATGFTMSPAIASAYPVLLDVFGGYQSARTVHFLGFTALLLFFIVHVAMVIATGFRQQLRGMTWGN